MVIKSLAVLLFWALPEYLQYFTTVENREFLKILLLSPPLLSLICGRKLRDAPGQKLNRLKLTIKELKSLISSTQFISPKRMRMRDPFVSLIIGLIVITDCIQSLSALESCHQELTRLQKQENLLKSQLQKQELLLHRLQLQNQPGNVYKASVDQIQDTELTDCSQIFSSGFKLGGRYRIRPKGSPGPITVFCDMTDGGGWTVLQRRINGTKTFNRSWAEYKKGFGDMVGEFWLGNDNLHYITAQGNYSLRINLEDFDGHQRVADYHNFKVEDEKKLYQLSFGDYAGTAGDALSGSHQVGVSEWASHQGMKFSTYDQDNDNYKGNCAQEDKGGWWFNKCHSAHLNGLYYPSGYYSAATDDGVVWYTWKGWWYSLKTSIMKLRPTDFKIDHDPNAVPPS